MLVFRSRQLAPLVAAKKKTSLRRSSVIIAFQSQALYTSFIYSLAALAFIF